MTRLAALGLNPLARWMIVLQAAILALSAWLDYRLGISLAWATAVPSLIGLAMVFALWLSFVARPGPTSERMTAETVLVLGLILVLTNIGAAAQYPAIAFGRPLIDAWLARADAGLGLNAARLTAFTRAHATYARALFVAYSTFLPQFILPIVLQGLVFRNRERLWEFAFHFHVCLAVTLAALALFPANVPAPHYGYVAIFDQTRFASQFAGLRDGTFRTIRLDQVEGLICMPSFHVAGALMVTWAFRGSWIVWPLAALNAVLILATLMSGVHWAVDVFATFPLFACSVAAYRWWGAPLLLRVR